MTLLSELKTKEAFGDFGHFSNLKSFHYIIYWIYIMPKVSVIWQGRLKTLGEIFKKSSE